MKSSRVYFTPTLPRDRQVVGPQGDFGIIVKAPGHGKKRDQILDKRQYLHEVEQNKIQFRERLKRDAIHSNFWSSADVRGTVGRIKRFVDLGLEAADEDLNERRNRMKAILLEEEAAWTQEYVDRAQKRADLEFEMKKRCAEKIVESKESEEKVFIENAYNRIFEETNVEFRANRSAKLREELNRIHELQMRDKELMKLKEEEDLQMWLAIMDKEDEIKLSREKAKLKERKRFFDKKKEILKKQMFGMKIQRENEEVLKKEELEFWREVNEQNKKEADLFLADRKDEEVNYWKALEEQMEVNKLERQRQEEEEKNMDQLMFDYNQAILEKERGQQVENKIQDRAEQQIFRESLRQFKTAMSSLEKESEDFIAKESADKRATKRALKKKANALRKEFYLSCAEARDRKMEVKRREKVESDQIEELLTRDKSMRCAQNDELELASSKAKMERTVTRDREVNGEQMKYQRLLAERAEEEDRDFMQRLRLKQQEDLERSRRLLANPRPSAMHPVTRSILFTTTN